MQAQPQELAPLYYSTRDAALVGQLSWLLQQGRPHLRLLALPPLEMPAHQQLPLLLQLQPLPEG